MKSIHLSLIAGAVIGLATTGCEHTAVTNTDSVSGSLTSKFVLSKVKTTNGDKVTEVGIVDNSAIANDSFTQQGQNYIQNANSLNILAFDINNNLEKNTTTTTVTSYNTRGLRTSYTRDTDKNNTFVEDSIVYNPVAGNGYIMSQSLDTDNDGHFDTVQERNTTNSLLIKSGGMDNTTLTEYASNGYKRKETAYSATGQVTSTTTKMPTSLDLNTTKDILTYNASNILTAHTIYKNDMLEYNKSYDANGLVTKEVNFTYGATKVTNSELFNRNGGITKVVITNHADTNASLNTIKTFTYFDTNETYHVLTQTDTTKNGAYDSNVTLTGQTLATAHTIDGISYAGTSFVTGAPTKFADNNYTLTYTGSLVTTLIQDAAADGAELNITYDANGYRSEHRVNANSDANVDTITSYTNGVQTKVTSDTNTDGNVNTVTTHIMSINNNTLATLSTTTYDDSAATAAASKRVTEVNTTQLGQAISNIQFLADGVGYNVGVTSNINTYDANYNLLTQKAFDGARSQTVPYDSNVTTYDAASFMNNVKVTSTHTMDVDTDGSFENKVVRSWGANGMALARYLANNNAQNTLTLGVANTAAAWFAADEVSISIFKDNQTTAQSSMVKTFVANSTQSFRSHVDGYADTVLAPATAGSAYSTIDVLNSGYHLTSFALDQEGTANDETREFTWEAKERQ